MIKHKPCKTCHADKPLSEFYRHSVTEDGLRGSCKACMKLAARKHRERNLAQYREYDRERDQRPERQAAREAYAATPAGAAALREAKKRWVERKRGCHPG